jgi:osmotically-inducible protein OsmY
MVKNLAWSESKMSCRPFEENLMHSRIRSLSIVTAMTSILSLSITSVLVLQLAGCAVAAVSGAATGVAIVNDRRTAGTIFDDQTIEVKSTHALAQNKFLWKKSHITPISYNNVLLLVGQAPNEELKRQAEEAVRDIPRVRKVYNELSASEPVSIGIRTQDSWITTQIKAKLLAAKGVNPTRIKVVTENGVVYLMGLTTPEEEITATEIARTVRGVEKVVQVFDHT